MKDSTSTDEPVLDLVRKAVENGDVSAIFVSLGVQPRGNTESSEFGVVVVCVSDPKGDNLLATVAIFRRMQEAGIHIHFVDSLWGIPVEENVVTRIRVFILPEAGERSEPEEPRSTHRSNGITKAPYGFDYDPVTGNWIVNQDESQGVQLMFQMAGEGKSNRDIAAALNSAGFRTKKGRPWIKNYVSITLRKQVYTGVQPQGRVPVERAVPRIIPQELFERVQKTVDDRRAADRYRDASFLLTGFVKCGHCEGPLLQSPRRGGPRYYRCGGTGAACRPPAVRAELLERQVWNGLREAILNPDEIMRSIRLAAEEDEQDIGTAADEPGVQKEEPGTSSKWQNTVADYCRRLAGNIDGLDREGKRAVLRELEVSITVSRNEEELSITVDIVFAETQMTDSGG